MSLFSMFAHTAVLDIGWWVWLIMGNLFWVFAMLAYHFIASDGKKLFKGFVIFMISIYAFVNFFEMQGLVFFSMPVFFISLMAYDMILGKTRFSKYSLLSFIFFYVALAFVFKGFGWSL